MPPRRPRLTPTERDLNKPVPAAERSERDWQAFARGYRSYAQQERIRQEIAEDRPRVATAYVHDLIEGGERSNLDAIFRDLYDYYTEEYPEDRDELVDAMRDIMSPSTAGEA